MHANPKLSCEAAQTGAPGGTPARPHRLELAQLHSAAPLSDPSSLRSRDLVNIRPSSLAARSCSATRTCFARTHRARHVAAARRQPRRADQRVDSCKGPDMRTLTVGMLRDATAFEGLAAGNCPLYVLDLSKYVVERLRRRTGLFRSIALPHTRQQNESSSLERRGFAHLGAHCKLLKLRPCHRSTCNDLRKILAAPRRNWRGLTQRSCNFDAIYSSWCFAA